MRHFLILLLAGFTSMAVAASTSEPAAQVHMLSADVSISTVGEVTAFSLPPNLAGVEANLRAVVGRWRFQPALLDGRAVPVQTSLKLRLTIATDADGAPQATVDLVGNGAGMADMAAPRYPATPLKARAAAVVLLELDYDAEGAVTDVRVLSSASTRPEYLVQFDEAAVAAARGWTLRPERLDGAGLAGTAVVPVRFAFDGGRQPPPLPPMPRIAGFDPESRLMVTRRPTPLVRIDAEG